MALDEGMQKWINEKLLSGLTGDARTQMETHIQKEEVANELKRAMMAPSDYSRKMDEITRQDQQRIQQLAEWQKAEKASYEAQMQAAIDANNTAWQAQVKEQAAAEGVELNVQKPTPKPNGNQPPNGNGNGDYMTKKQFEQILLEREAEYAMLPAVQQQILVTHNKLFGDYPDMVKLTQEAFRLGKPLNNVWEEMYSVPAKRAELDKLAFDAKVQEEARKLAVSMASGQGMLNERMRPSATLSPIGNFLKTASQSVDGKEPLVAPQPAQVTSPAVNDANDAYFSGKYATKYPGQS